MASQPITLGEILASDTDAQRELDGSTWFRATLLKLLTASVLAGMSVLALWWFLGQPDFDETLALIAFLVLFAFFWLAARGSHRKQKHFLLQDDRQGFMRALRLDEKTAVVDGSNIYHLGHSNGLDAQPLGEVADLLRSQGYRIVCFFDANIYFTLGEHGAFKSDARHSIALLETAFGLHEDEIYVVPSGVQADRYILECLTHLPISFAVTNDKYRDYKDAYRTVMRDNLWRKEVAISNGETKLLRHNV